MIYQIRYIEKRGKRRKKEKKRGKKPIFTLKVKFVWYLARQILGENDFSGKDLPLQVLPKKSNAIKTNLFLHIMNKISYKK